MKVKVFIRWEMYYKKEFLLLPSMNPEFHLFLGALLKCCKEKRIVCTDRHESPLDTAAHAASKQAAILVRQNHMILGKSMARTFLC